MKTITISKRTLLDIVAQVYVKGLVEGHNSKKNQYRKKPYRLARKFILHTYWYKK